MKALLLVMLLAGCEIPRQECYGSGTCGEGQMCGGGHCYAQCREDSDCDGSLVCRQATIPGGLGSAPWQGFVCVAEGEESL